MVAGHKEQKAGCDNTCVQYLLLAATMTTHVGSEVVVKEHQLRCTAFVGLEESVVSCGSTKPNPATCLISEHLQCSAILIGLPQGKEEAVFVIRVWMH